MEFTEVSARKGSKDWVVSNLKMHAHYVDKFYNNADSHITSEVQKDIVTAVSSNIRYDNRRNTNTDLREKLLKLGWEKEIGVAKKKKIAVDYKKKWYWFGS